GETDEKSEVGAIHSAALQHQMSHLDDEVMEIAKVVAALAANPIASDRCRCSAAQLSCSTELGDQRLKLSGASTSAAPRFIATKRYVRDGCTSKMVEDGEKLYCAGPNRTVMT